MAKKIEVYSGSKLVTTLKKNAVILCVRRLVMAWIVENVSARYLPIKPAEEIPAVRFNYLRHTENEPSQSPRMGKLKWEPPKSKRQLKAHPWQNIIVDQRSNAAY